MPAPRGTGGVGHPFDTGSSGTGLAAADSGKTGAAEVVVVVEVLVVGAGVVVVVEVVVVVVEAVVVGL